MQGNPKLSICISTFNRASLIGETLESMVNQATEECEIVVLDGASTDDTEATIVRYARLFPRLRYIRKSENGGLDRDRDEVVKCALGDYCWLMSSKDLIKPGAIAAVLKLLPYEPSVIGTNMEVKDSTLKKTLIARGVAFKEDVTYGPGENDKLFREAFPVLSHISCAIVKRSVWMAREREQYYGSLHVHLGVIFQKPLPGNTIVTSSLLVCHRFGNQTWLSQATRAALLWPAFIESLAITEETKRKYSPSKTRPSFNTLLTHRACGVYSRSDYCNIVRPHLSGFGERAIAAFIAVIPGRFVNGILVLMNRFGRHHYRGVALQMLRESRFHILNWRGVKFDL